VLGDFQKGNSEDMRLAIDAADDAFQEWSDMPPTERARYLLRAGDIIEQQKQ
jgi:acyl-CoA reductase-like NAD-dependent aldehyde dehydrogenase